MQRYFAVVAGSLEKHARTELERFGAEILGEVPRGLDFRATREQLYRILYSARLIQRVLEPLKNFDCHSHKYLYSQASANINWPAIFKVDQSFGINCNVSDSFTKHSLYSSQVLKDAICDSFRDSSGRRPDYTNRNPDILFNLHIHNNRATISQDLLGISMHKRGYRKASVDAPLQETLAAAIITLSGWEGDNPLWDPMCGSGTLASEALMHYCRIPAGYLRDHRRLSLMQGFDPRLWDRIVSEANSEIRPLPQGLIQASDLNQRAIEATRTNLNALPHSQNIKLFTDDIRRSKASFSGTLVCNPPYGVRLRNSADIARLYNDLGDFLKQNCPGSTAYILCGSKELIREIRLRAHWSKALKNGPLDTRLAKIVIHPRIKRAKAKT